MLFVQGHWSLGNSMSTRQLPPVKQSLISSLRHFAKKYNNFADELEKVAPVEAGTIIDFKVHFALNYDLSVWLKTLIPAMHKEGLVNQEILFELWRRFGKSFLTKKDEQKIME